jgi:hypothetical protein
VRDALQATASENQDLMKQSKDLVVVIAKLKAVFRPQGPDLFLQMCWGSWTRFRESIEASTNRM